MRISDWSSDVCSSDLGEGAEDAVARAAALHARMRALIDAIEGGALGPIRHVLHVGIGGSALGPDLLIDALGREEDRYDVAIVSNVDGAAPEEAFARFDPAAKIGRASCRERVGKYVSN